MLQPHLYCSTSLDGKYSTSEICPSWVATQVVPGIPCKGNTIYRVLWGRLLREIATWVVGQMKAGGKYVCGCINYSTHVSKKIFMDLPGSKK